MVRFKTKEIDSYYAANSILNFIDYAESICIALADIMVHYHYTANVCILGGKIHCSISMEKIILEMFKD